MSFERNVDPGIIESLKMEPLFKKKLKPDILKGDIFMAIRKNKIGFYYRGGRLFSFGEGGFRTHVKYAAVLNVKKEKDYVTAKEFGKIGKVDNFLDGYDRIKENCDLYAGVEATGVSEVYKKFPYIKNSEIVVLDVEVAFSEGDEDEGGPDKQKKKKNRIDLLLFYKKTGTLRFYEAKHFSNGEIWSKTEPKVVLQIIRYNRKIGMEAENIKVQYSRFVSIVKDILSEEGQECCNIGKINYMDPECWLYVFGFDENQRAGRLSELLMPPIEKNKIKKYFKGEPPKNLKGMWKGN